MSASAPAGGLAAVRPAESGGFSAVCAALCEARESSDFPLHRRVRLRSHIAFAFAPEDFRLEAAVSEGADEGLPRMRIAFLTLAGPDGPLPMWITEKILRNTDGEGEALHRFLDLLNRRFWELLFLRDRLADHPRYGLAATAPAEVLDGLPFALAAMDRGLVRPSAADDAGFFQRLRRHCRTTVPGAGGAQALAALLAEACGCDVEVRMHGVVRLPVADRSRLRLSEGGLSSDRRVIGGWGLVQGGVQVSMTLPDAARLEAFLPAGAGLEKVRIVVDVFYGTGVPPLALRLRCRSHASHAALGGHLCRVGWGAMLYSPAPHSQIVCLSARMAAASELETEGLMR